MDIVDSPAHYQETSHKSDNVPACCLHAPLYFRFIVQRRTEAQMSNLDDKDREYRELLISPIRTCASYLPKMGGSDGVDLKTFTKLYGADPLYHWMGFDSPLMFAAHKAAGGMTSLYRQLGIGVERLFRHILMDSFGLEEHEANWNYEYTKPNNKTATRYLDGRLDLELIANANVRSADIVQEWMKDVERKLDITIPLRGAVFEVREGYKSADSKRQNGDLDNLSQALKKGYLMTMVLMSLQINETVRKRYQEGGLLVLIGDAYCDDPCESTYGFLKEVAGYDLASFFERNTEELKRQTASILEHLLNKEN